MELGKVDVKKVIIIAVVITLLMFLFAIVIQTTSIQNNSSPESKQNVYEIYQSDEVLEVINTPDTVTANRLEHWEPESDTEPPYEFHEYKPVGQPVTLTEKNSEALVAILLNPDSYEWETAKDCFFLPGYQVRFSRDNSIVDVLFCFNCDQLRVYLDEQTIGGKDYDDVSRKLRRV
jgi:hypothetical protein